MILPRLPLALLACLVAAPLAIAAESMPGMTLAPAAKTPAAAESAKAMAAMHKAMMAPYSGDADVDFATHMLPHHQGAVAMAEIELKYGKDPEMRALAQAVMAAQEAEMKQMNAWLALHRK